MQKIWGPEQSLNLLKKICLLNFVFSNTIRPNRTNYPDSAAIFVVDLDLHFQGYVAFLKVTFLIKQHPISLKPL